MKLSKRDENQITNIFIPTFLSNLKKGNNPVLVKKLIVLLVDKTSDINRGKKIVNNAKLLKTINPDKTGIVLLCIFCVETSKLEIFHGEEMQVDIGGH